MFKDLCYVVTLAAWLVQAGAAIAQDQSGASPAALPDGVSATAGALPQPPTPAPGAVLMYVLPTSAGSYTVTLQPQPPAAAAPGTPPAPLGPAPQPYAGFAAAPPAAAGVQALAAAAAAPATPAPPAGGATGHHVGHTHTAAAPSAGNHVRSLSWYHEGPSWTWPFRRQHKEPAPPKPAPPMWQDAPPAKPLPCPQLPSKCPMGDHPGCLLCR